MNLMRRRALLTAALGFAQLAPRAPELQLLHRWLDNWTGLGLIVVGVERQGLRFSLSHIAEGEWRAYFMGNPSPSQVVTTPVQSASVEPTDAAACEAEASAVEWGRARETRATPLA